MEQLTSDPKGVAVYIDNILVSGVSAVEHFENVCALLQQLQDIAADKRSVCLLSLLLSTWDTHCPAME